MPLPLLKLRPYGAIYDLPAQQVPPDKYTLAANVRFQEGAVERGQGALEVSPAAPHVPEKLVYTWDASNDYWLYPGADQISVWNGVLHTDITPVGHPAGLQEQFWTACVFNQIPVINHPGLVAPVFWDRQLANPMSAIPAWPAGWGTFNIRTFKNFMLALGRFEVGQDYDGQLINWSDAAPPGSLPGEWVATPTNLAGDAVLSDTAGAVVDGVSLRDGFIIYKENSTFLMEFIGGAQVMSIRKIFESMGALAEGCVTEVNGKHIVLTDGNIVSHDGLSVDEIGTNTMRRYLFADMHSQHYRRSIVRHDQANRAVIIAYPDTESNGWINKAIVWNYIDNTWSQSFLPSGLETNKDYITDLAYGAYTTSQIFPEVDWDSATDEWDDNHVPWDYDNERPGRNQGVSAIAGTINNLALGGYADDFVGEVIPFLLEKTGIDLDQTDRLKYVTRLWPRFSSGSSPGGKLVFQIGAARQIDQETVWGIDREYVLGSGMYIDADAMGRSFGVRVKPHATEPALNWRLVGFDFEFRPAGRF